jgi:hypothetical protein
MEEQQMLLDCKIGPIMVTQAHVWLFENFKDQCFSSLLWVWMFLGKKIYSIPQNDIFGNNFLAIYWSCSYILFFHFLRKAAGASSRMGVNPGVAGRHKQ